MSIPEKWEIEALVEMAIKLSVLSVKRSERVAYYRCVGELAVCGVPPELVSDIARAWSAGRVEASLLRKHGLEVGCGDD